MVINKSKVIIRPEKPSEYEEVNKLISFILEHGGCITVEPAWTESEV